MITSTLNLRGTKPCLNSLLSLFNVDILCLTETWSASATGLPGFCTSELFGYEVKNRKRLSGGICIHTKKPHRLMTSINSPFVQAIVIRMEDITFVGCYVAPHQTHENLFKILSPITPFCKGRCILMGDFNARSTLWDAKTNPQGNFLRKWCNRLNLKISAPPQPTCRDTSTVDLALYKGMYPGCITTATGSWSALSDHEAVICELHRKPPPRPIRVPQKILQCNTRREASRREYEDTIPKTVNSFDCASDAAALETASEEFVSATLSPWINQFSNKPPRFKPGWTYALDRKAKHRTRLLRKYAGNNSAETKREIKVLDRQIKNERRANLRDSEAKMAKEFASLPAREAAIRFAKNRTIADDSPTCDGDAYTKFIEKKQTHDANIAPCDMLPPPGFLKEIRRAIACAPLNRAPGPDGIVTEMFRLSPDAFANAILALWKACGRLQHAPRLLLTGLIVPIHKKGDTADPANYRPIMLMSHVRKIISIAINKSIQGIYTPHQSQFGFLQHCGTEIATIRANSIVNSGNHWIALLDLKGAYDTVRRDKLLAICRQVLTPPILAMVQFLLINVHFTTKLQCTRHTGLLTMGVPQGDPCSPTLFNIFMDTFLQRCAPTPGADTQCYADDVFLAGKSQDTLQSQLDTAAAWANDMQMHWAPSKCVIIASDKLAQLNFCGENLRHVDHAPYLGTTVEIDGCSDRLTTQRYKSVLMKIEKWRRLETSTTPLRRSTKLILLRQFLLPAVDFGTHLTKRQHLTPQLEAKFNNAVLRWILQRDAKTSIQRARALIGLPSSDTRRALLLRVRHARIWNNALRYPNQQNAHRLRMAYCHHPTVLAESIATPHPSSFIPLAATNAKRDEILAREWRDANRHHTREIPTTGNVPPAAYSVSARFHRILDAWYLNRLPKLPRFLHTQLTDVLRLRKVDAQHLGSLLATTQAIISEND